MHSSTRTVLLLSVAIAVLTAGCATKKYVRTEVGTSETKTGERISGVEGQVEEAQNKLASHDGQLGDHGQRIGEVSQTAQDALQRAMEAGKLAEGKLLWETALTSDRVRFAFESADVSDEMRQALDEFGASLTAENANVFIEIQGHTDSTGPEEYNLKLGEERAEAVRRYLNREHAIPLHRIATISYGEGAPVSDNATREGRAQNRRVVLVVLQ